MHILEAWCVGILLVEAKKFQIETKQTSGFDLHSGIEEKNNKPSVFVIIITMAILWPVTLTTTVEKAQ